MCIKKHYLCAIGTLLSTKYITWFFIWGPTSFYKYNKNKDAAYNNNNNRCGIHDDCLSLQYSLVSIFVKIEARVGTYTNPHYTMEAIICMYRRTNPLGPIEKNKLQDCSLRIVQQRDKQIILRIRLIQELKQKQKTVV